MSNFFHHAAAFPPHCVLQCREVSLQSQREESFCTHGGSFNTSKHSALTKSSSFGKVSYLLCSLYHCFTGHRYIIPTNFTSGMYSLTDSLVIQGPLWSFPGHSLPSAFNVLGLICQRLGLCSAWQALTWLGFSVYYTSFPNAAHQYNSGHLIQETFSNWVQHRMI